MSFLGWEEVKSPISKLRKARRLFPTYAFAFDGNVFFETSLVGRQTRSHLNVVL